MESKHTKGEWKSVEMVSPTNRFYGSHWWVQTDKKLIATIEPNGMPEEECEANAAHIVKCVNAHDELVRQNEVLKNSFKMILDKRNSAGWDAECSALLAESTLKKVNDTTK